MKTTKSAPTQPSGSVRFINLYRNNSGGVDSRGSHANVESALGAICHDGTYVGTIKLTTKVETI